MKTPTCEEITRKLQHSHFPNTPSLGQPADPACDTPMLVTLEQLRPYDHNPRFIRNPLYADIKESIRERGLDQPPAITRRPGEAHFIIRNGGNTRLAILNELWQETRDQQFFRIACLFRPWSTETHALLGHLAESDLHGQLTFIERALAVAKLRDMLQADSAPLSQRELAKRLGEGGYPISQPHISRMFDTLEHLLPAMPQVLYTGLGKQLIERTISLRRRSEAVWNRYAFDVGDFEPLWLESLAQFDGDAADFDLSQVEDELLARMADILRQSPRTLALDLAQVASAVTVPPPVVHGDEHGESGPSLGMFLESSSSQDAMLERNPVPQMSEDTSRSNALPKTLQAEHEEEEVQPAVASPADAAAISLPTSLDQLWLLSLKHVSAGRLRQACAQLALQLAEYGDLGDGVVPMNTHLGFSLTPAIEPPSEPRSLGIQLLLGSLLRLHDEVLWEHQQQLPAALFGQLLTGVYDQPLEDHQPLPMKLERLPDEQLLQLFCLVRLSRQLIDLSLSSTR
ncbi:ParB family protein [Pseudomonas eucalypticola]|uniref:Chromosome partitioning protein ParB n=1 Tax=Pseudomonas eucalypticola TaxID=2599595 RepID=A0A7D5HCT9_9PSED|nr:ParB family protein [Pseudomonas eucalypticola]QKZ04210.1 chromosome partitioning protein ParB [Pseudomonas eucalypticola]